MVTVTAAVAVAVAVTVTVTVTMTVAVTVTVMVMVVVTASSTRTSTPCKNKQQQQQVHYSSQLAPASLVRSLWRAWQDPSLMRLGGGDPCDADNCEIKWQGRQQRWR